MTPTQRIFAVTVSIVIFLFILELVRRRKIGIQYSVLWILTGASLLVLSLWYDGLLALTKFIGAVLPTTTLFIFGILFLGLFSLHLTIRLSGQQQMTVQLAQEVALLRHEMEKNREQEATPSGRNVGE